jgi:hypothetical protein
MSANENPPPASQPTTPVGWRYKLGMAMFVLPIVSMVLTPIAIPLLGLSGTESASLIGGIFLGGELIWFGSLPFLGKEGFARLKSQLFGMFRLTDKPISKSRHSWGLGLIGGSLLFQGLVLIWIVFGFFYLGAGHLAESVGGVSFGQEAAFVAYGLIVSAVAFFIGVWLLGGQFVQRLNSAMTWQEVR